MSSATSHDSASPSSPSMKHAIHRNTLDGHSKRVWCVAPLDDERVVSASDDDSVIVWKFRTKKQEHALFHKGATTVAVSHDRKIIVSAGRDCALQLWDADSGKLLSGPWKLHKDRVWSVTWSPDGSRIASCSADSNLIIWKWEAHSTSPSGESFLGPISTEQKAVHSVAYSPFGEKLATGGFDFTIKIWDAGTGSLQTTLCGHTMSVSSLAWTKDGNRVISGSLDHTVRIWDILKKEEMYKIPAHTDAIKYIAVSDHVFATVSYDKAYLWSLKTHRRLPASFEFSQYDEANCVALSKDETTIAACTERGKVYTWNIGIITSVIKQNVEGNEVDDIGNIYATGLSPFGDNDSDPYDNFFIDGVKLPAKKTQDTTVKFIQRMVAPLRIPRNTVVLTARRRFKRLPGSLSVEPAPETNETENYHDQRSVAAIRRLSESAPERYSQTTTTLGYVQPSSANTLRERSRWTKFLATTEVDIPPS
ncbi:WD40 repeat-like protein [Rhizopogon vinicolor AM-OR11-026]|uniref:WD40 repeat-like protein n=1 Tax=Rhizopogon vinicolor AM-OR11-026 TaxID=1314800 RepID=A0A1B7MHU9_9AGAM|nr:WD40 repeat-like protein [Rhizopogon vinicolor AM-OR11-026]